MRSEIAVEAVLASSEGISVDYSNSTFMDVSFEYGFQRCTHKGIHIMRLNDLATSNCYGTTQVYLASIEKSAYEDYGHGVDSPYNLALVYRAQMVDMNSYVSCRAWSLPCSNGCILKVSQRLVLALAADTYVHLGDFGQCRDTSLEICLLSLHLKVEVACKRHVPECRDKDGLGRCVGGC